MQGCQVTLVTKVCTVAPSICQSSGQNCCMSPSWCLEFGGVKSVYCHNSLKFYNQLSNYQLSKDNTVPCYHICYQSWWAITCVPLFQHTVNKAFHQVEGFEDHPVVSLTMEKGDTVFFHPILVHGSGINKTKVKFLTRYTTQN